MHAAERQLTIALPLIVAAAKSKDLKTLLQIHLKETRGHVKALDGVARHLGLALPTRICARMTALIAEGVKVIGKRVVTAEQDAALIRVGRKIEQFEIRRYRDLCAAAKQAGLPHELAILTSVLNQEEMADELLAGLAARKGPIKELVEAASLKRVS